MPSSRKNQSPRSAASGTPRKVAAESSVAASERKIAHPGSARAPTSHSRELPPRDTRWPSTTVASKKRPRTAPSTAPIPTAKAASGVGTRTRL